MAGWWASAWVGMRAGMWAGMWAAICAPWRGLPAPLLHAPVLLAASLACGSAALAQSDAASAPAAAAAPAASTAPQPAVALAEGPSWGSLRPAQQAALAPLVREWISIDATRKAKWLQLAERYPRLSPTEQRRLQDRMREWAHMSPAERGQARLTFQENKALSAAQKQARWDAYNALTPDARRALAERNRQLAERNKPAPTPPALALDAAQPKQNRVVTPPPAVVGPRAKPVAPTVMQAKPGATTTLMTHAPAPPQHQKPGQPKIEAGPRLVDGKTLLPLRGPQAAAVAASAAAAASLPASR